MSCYQGLGIEGYKYIAIYTHTHTKSLWYNLSFKVGVSSSLPGLKRRGLFLCVYVFTS